MTTIASVRAIPLAITLDEPWDFSIERYAQTTCVLVEVTTDSGLVGYGEAIARKSPRSAAMVVDDLLAPLAVGRDLRDAGQIWFACVDSLRRWGHSRGFLLEALAGLDIALWDLRARDLDRSVADLLPWGARRQVPVYASSIYFKPTVAEAVELAESTVKEGHRALKIKTGHRAEDGGIGRDVQTVQAIRDAVGSQVTLMCDVNSMYTYADALRFTRQVADCDLQWIEEPFPPDDLDGYAALARTSPVPIAAGESEFGVHGFRDLIARDALAFAQPDIARCGGFTGALQIASYCYAHHVPVMPHTGFSGGINNLASTLLAATVPEGGMLEHMIIGNPLRELFTEPLPDPVDGVVAVPDGPGLGHDVDPERLDAFRAATSS